MRRGSFSNPSCMAAMGNTATLPDAEALYSKLLAQLRGAVDPSVGMVGIHTGGVWLAERLHKDLTLQLPLASIDVTLHRDDFEQIGLHRNAKRSAIPFEVAGTHILLVDDVLYTGRTIRAAMNELFDFGRPASIRLAALVDRQSRELPIAAQFIGGLWQVPDDEILVLERNPGGNLQFSVEKKSH